MLGIARWAVKAAVTGPQRFFSQALPWAMLFWMFRQHVYHSDEVYLLVGDEVVATKAGKHTHGLDRFFSSLYGKPVPGLAFFTLSLVSIQQRRSFPIHIEQVCAVTPKRRPARPKRTPRSTGPLHRPAPSGASEGEQEYSQS